MSLPPEQLDDLIQSYNKDSGSLKEQIIEICYFMKGGIELESAWTMSFQDREIAVKVLNRRIKEANPSSKDYM